MYFLLVYIFRLSVTDPMYIHRDRKISISAELGCKTLSSERASNANNLCRRIEVVATYKYADNALFDPYQPGVVSIKLITIYLLQVSLSWHQLIVEAKVWRKKLLREIAPPGSYNRSLIGDQS